MEKLSLKDIKPFIRWGRLDGKNSTGTPIVLRFDCNIKTINNVVLHYCQRRTFFRCGSVTRMVEEFLHSISNEILKIYMFGSNHENKDDSYKFLTKNLIQKAAMRVL